MKLYSPPDNHQLAKILFTANLSRTALTHEPVPYGYKNKHFQEQNALFTTPALELQPHQYVFGTHSILRHLAPKDSSTTPFQQASISQWLELIERELQPAIGVLILMSNQLTEVKEEQVTKAKEAVLKVAKQLQERLKLNTFLVGQSLTIADVSAYFSWMEVSPQLEKEAKGLVNLQRWAKYIASIPNH